MVEFVAYPRHIYLPYNLSGFSSQARRPPPPETSDAPWRDQVQQGHEASFSGSACMAILGGEKWMGTPLCHLISSC
jgi:hypothetical protein